MCKKDNFKCLFKENVDNINKFDCVFHGELLESCEECKSNISYFCNCCLNCYYEFCKDCIHNDNNR